MGYSANLLLNPSAEFGLMNWQTSNVSIVVGASQGSYSFKVDPIGNMSQTIVFEKSPPDIQFDIDYWLLSPLEELNIDTRARIELAIHYNDSTVDTLLYPCRGTASEWHGIRETILFGIRAEDKQLTSITVTVKCLDFMDGLIIDALAIRKQESDTSPVDTGKYDDFWETAITYGLDINKPLLRG
jgi:hypothetical protein